MAAIVKLTEDDLLPTLKGFYNNKKVAVPLTGCTVKLHIDYKTGVVTKVATLDEPAGLFRFEWAVGDLQRGRWPAHIVIIDSQLKPLTYRNLVLDIGKKLA